MKKILLLIFTLMVHFLSAQVGDNAYRIKYISADNIYLDSGSDAGIEIGDSLLVQKNGEVIARLEVLYVAQYSASCRIITAKRQLEIGDLVNQSKKKKTVSDSSDQGAQRERQILQRTDSSVRKEPFARINGDVSLQWYHFEDRKNSNFNFDQPSLRLNFKASRLWGKEYNFRIKLRLRYNRRAKPYSSYVPEREWRNRIYMFSFSYDDEKSFLNYKIGRIISNKFSGVGYIDGLLLQHNLSYIFKWGLFAGTQPQWQYSKFQTSLQKYGMYFNYITGSYLKTRFETALALAAEYHGKTISREFVYWQTSAFGRDRWSLYNSIELDVNRDWREVRAGEAVSVTGFYLSGRYKFAQWFTSALSYDNRKNYFTYETRTLADSLFDNALRYGLRTDFYFNLPAKFSIAAQVGLRTREGDSQTTKSFRGSLRKADFLVRRMSINLSITGYSSYLSKGLQPSLRISKTLFNRHNLSVSYVGNVYTLRLNESQRKSQWVRITAIFELRYRVYCSGEYEYSWGDDSNGHRGLVVLGFRF